MTQKEEKIEIHRNATPSKKHSYYQTNHHASYHRRGKLSQLFEVHCVEGFFTVKRGRAFVLIDKNGKCL